MSPIYLIISPVRNEAQRIGLTIESMVSQTIRPAEWVIVDDGSTDGTVEIIEMAQAAHRWIKLVRRKDRGFRKPGTGVMEAFHEGLAAARTERWDYLGKIDGDLAFEPDYFARCFREFDRDLTLGIGGGVICRRTAEGIVPEVFNDPAFHVRGATKLYRRACWDAIGGLIRTTGWDTMDEVHANMLGWTTYSFADLKVVQMKDTGSADGSWKNWFKNGRANYIVGYSPIFMVGKCMKRAFERPFLTVSLALFCGYASGYLLRIPRPGSRELTRYLRREQMKSMLGRDSLWRRQRPSQMDVRTLASQPQ